MSLSLLLGGSVFPLAPPMARGVTGKAMPVAPILPFFLSGAGAIGVQKLLAILTGALHPFIGHGATNAGQIFK